MMLNIKIPEKEHGTRLDRCVRRLLGQLNQSLLEKCLRSGMILLDGKKAKSSTKVSYGQELNYSQKLSFDKPYQVKKISEYNETYYKNLFKKIFIKETSEYIAINKPSGLAVQGGSKQKFHVDDMLKCISTDNVSLKLVHRIDKDTSGLLLLAKENKVAKKFTSFFKDRKIIKTYLAIVSPCPNDDRGTIDLPLSKSGTKDYQRMSVDQNMGKRAITDYKVLDKVGSRVALVALFPKTGRTHQLRVHLEYINAPIVGDNKYRGLSEVYMSSQNLPEHKKLSQIKWIPNNIKNLQLHAYSIRIPESETITAEVSEDFKQNLKFLGLKLPKKLHDIFI